MRELNRAKKVVCLISVIVVILVITGFWVHLGSYSEGTESTVSDTKNDVYIQVDSEREPFGNIITQTFTFYNTETDEPEPFATGEIELASIIEAVNNYLSTSNYKVCELGVIGDKLYIEQNITETVDTANSMKINIVSLSSSLETEDWIELIEQIYSENNVMAGSTITNYTTFGSRHYMYAYQTVNEVK